MPVTAIGPGSKFRPDRCRQLSRPLLQSARHPHGRARRAARKCQFPPQFSPLWKPPFPDPPSKLESTKGGETAGGTGTAAFMARLGKPRGPSLPAEPRAAALRVPGSTPPLVPLAPRPPRGRALSRASMRFARSPPFRPSKEFASSPMMRGYALAPLRLITPKGVGALVLRRRAGPARKSACKTMMGRSPYPLGDARVVRRPGIDQASVISYATTPISGNRY